MLKTLIANRKLRQRNKELTAEAKHMASIAVDLRMEKLKLEDEIQKAHGAEFLEQICQEQATTIDSLHTELNAIKVSIPHLVDGYELSKKLKKENKLLKDKLKQATNRIDIEKRKRKQKKGFYYFNRENK